VEQEGVRRAREQIARSDLVLWVYDATKGLDPTGLADIPPGVPVTRVRNKIDLLESPPRVPIPDQEEISLSALTGEGLDRLKGLIKTRAGVDSLAEGAFVARRRHLEALEQGLAHLQSAQKALTGRLGIELIALDLAAAQRAFGEITGAFTPDDLLGRIFGSFCIGK
jgi:tRNA modification GTPase